MRRRTDTVHWPLLGLTLLCACSAPEFVPPPGPEQATAAAHVFITRLLRAEDSEDPFVEGVSGALLEALILQGYDVSGVSYDPASVEALRERLAELNERRPGTSAIHLTFVETPHLVGLGTSYLAIRCAIYSPRGVLLKESPMTVPSFNPLAALLIPTRDPHTKGRRWLRESWLEIEPFFPPRP